MKAKYVLLASIISALVLPLLGQTAKIEVLHNFGASNDGNVPSGPLYAANNGSLYGVTGGGPGLYGFGVAFELTPAKDGSWAEIILHTFAGKTDGGFPWGGLLSDKSGNLYGTLEGDVGGDIWGIFELTQGQNGWTNEIISTENTGPGLLFDGHRNLYGDIGPGRSSSGAIGKISPDFGNWIYTQLYSFCTPDGCPDGWNLPDPPIWDSKENLWGTTFEGGIGRPACANFSGGCGVIFAMTPNGDGTWTYHVVHRFASSPTDGQFPAGGLLTDSAGTFYGSTEGGGVYGTGTIFKFSDNHGKLQGQYLYNFPNCMQGCYPMGTLARDSLGNLYGMAQGGTNSCGGLSCGVVYRLSPQADGTWEYSVLVNLSETTGGVLPFYGLTLDGKGHLFGVTSSFGLYDGGTAFEITP